MYGIEFLVVSYIKYLDLINNRIDFDDDNVFRELFELEVLDFSYNVYYFRIVGVTYRLGFI